MDVGKSLNPAIDIGQVSGAKNDKSLVFIKYDLNTRIKFIDVSVSTILSNSKIFL